MASRMKKLFHKQDDDPDSAQQYPDSPTRTRLSRETARDPAFRHSLYNETTPGQEPVVGTYPRAGNNTAGASARNSSNIPRGHHPSSSTDYASPNVTQQDTVASDFSGLNVGHGERGQ